jgi:hypothetical protein
MSRRFIEKWKNTKRINPIMRDCPSWMKIAIQHDVSVRCKDMLIIEKLYIND